MDTLTETITDEAQGVDLAVLVFLVFIYVSDSEKDITPQEVQRFQMLMNDLHWTDNEDMCRALTTLRFNYTATWAEYEAGTLSADRDAIARQLARFEQEFGSERANALKAALADLVQRVSRGSSRAGVRFAIGESRGRASARQELEALLARPMPAVATTAPREADIDPQPEPAPKPPAGTDLWTGAGMAIGEAPVWQGGRIKVRCIAAIDETRDTRTFTLATDPPRLFSYKPGQFVTLELPVDGRTLRRSYTISSSPSRPYTLSITVKRVPKGWVSNWLHDTVAPGFELELIGPHGHFTCVDRPAAKLLFLAGGSGITPAMSMLRWLADTGCAADIVLINNVRTPDDVIFGQELQHLSSRLGDAFRLAVVPARMSPGQSWNGPTGHFSEALLQLLAPDVLEREVFVCGPGGYMAMVRTLLQARGFPMARYHEESFGGASASVPALPAPQASPVPKAPPVPKATAAAAPAPVAPAEARLVFLNSDRTIDCGAGESILDAADRHAIPVQSSCRSGVCGTCRMKKLSGTVSMEGRVALSDPEVADGYFLACIGQARGTVVIDA
ncbi:hybrid-cluster NAD(P)-dependent oxidoreductase [Inquilinus sp. OTU3971]|uniref:hybrid-cluster NAD(P)-dependent oxidoreductase n=1 Tax=Inquilinus sp. OTU3971 TaxID=3043855 RepID=UPI00313A7787